MNASLLLLSSAWMAAADPAPIMVNGTGCVNCGSAATSYAPTFASASFGASACGSCGTGRVGLFDRLRARFSRSSASGCGLDCGLAAAPACGTPACGTPLQSSFVPSYTAYAAPSCDGPAVRSSFAIGNSGCCDPAPAARTGLFSRLRARLSRSSGCATVLACNGCTGSLGTVYSSPVMSAPAVMPAPATGPTTMPPADKPKDMEPVKSKDKTSTEPAPIVPLVPSDLPRIPTLNGLGGD